MATDRYHFGAGRDCPKCQPSAHDPMDELTYAEVGEVMAGTRPAPEIGLRSPLPENLRGRFPESGDDARGSCPTCNADLGPSSSYPWHLPEEDCRAVRGPVKRGDSEPRRPNLGLAPEIPGNPSNTAREHEAIPSLTAKDLATIQAALRYWQQDLAENDRDEIDGRGYFAEVPPLTVGEIDALYERLSKP